MAEAIEQVKGIGPASAALLAEAGIDTAEKLAASEMAEVVAIRGFNEIRAARVIEAARRLLLAPGGVVVSSPLSPDAASPKKKVKESKDKKDKKNKTKKEKKKEKDKKEGRKKDKKKKSDKKDKKKK